MTPHPYISIITEYIRPKLSTNYQVEYEARTNEIRINDNRRDPAYGELLTLTLTGTTTIIENDPDDQAHPHLDLNDPNCFDQLDHYLNDYYGPNSY